MIPPQATIDKLVIAYNAGDARAFANLFTADAVVYEHPARLTQSSRDELFEYYTTVFKTYPDNQTQILYRVVSGNRIIDHERVQRSPDHEPFDVVTIYELDSDGLIRRLDFIRDDRHVVAV